MSLAASRPSFFARALHHLRFRLYGRRAGLGQPVHAVALDREYASGAWDHFFGPDELARNDRLAALIHGARPRPRLLDLGCGSGRLLSLLNSSALDGYLGVDISTEGLRRARSLDRPAPLDRFEIHDFETWTPQPGSYDVITFNECLGYAPDPLRTALRFAATLPADGVLLVSHFQSGNHLEFWQRLARRFDFMEAHAVNNTKGQVWDIRSLRLRA